MEGEEVFTVSAQADFGVSATVLDSRKVQIWPVARAEIKGCDPDAYYEEVPTITVSLKDLYPDSKTFLRIYHGVALEDEEDAITVAESCVLISDSIPQDRNLTLKELDRYLNEEGVHTIEVLHETPFGIDILTEASIRVDRTVEIKGGALYGQE